MISLDAAYLRSVADVDIKIARATRIHAMPRRAIYAARASAPPRALRALRTPTRAYIARGARLPR